MNKKLDYWLQKYTEARSLRDELDRKIKRRQELYAGTAQPINPKTGKISTKKADFKRNMCYELIETQVNNSIPQPKVTPRDPDKVDLATDIEGYLQMESDRINSEEQNDSAERGTLKQGNYFYLVEWDETQNTHKTSGELKVTGLRLDEVYPQPGIKCMRDAEYVFTRTLVSREKIKDVYGVEVPEGPKYKDFNILITVHYLSRKGYYSKFGWIENTDIIVFDEEDYEIRKIKVCKRCNAPMHDNDTCPDCGYDKHEYISMEDEVLTEDIIKINIDDPNSQEILAKKGTTIPYYKIRQIPIVLRKNISDDTSLYGMSDIDLLESNQISMNKILTKMEENILKAGSFITKPKGVNIPNTDETLKVVELKDPNQIKAISIQTVQANMQQDNILQEEFYQMGRDVLGITDSYQGKRDTTAESGKAKQVAASQAAGRMESKRRMKDAAYADLYELMFKFLLAYCDETRTYARMTPNGEYVKGQFSRYNYLDGVPGDVYYNDRFLFSVDDASTLATNRTAMWQETTNNFAAGTFGNPADPQTLLLYWNVMKGLNYPLAKNAISSLQQRAQQLPYEMQQAIINNPDILKAVQQAIQNPEVTNENNQQ